MSVLKTLSSEQIERWEEWIEALRSDRFIQIRGRLLGGVKDGRQECCVMGVALYLANGRYNEPIRFDHSCYGSSLSPAFCEALGLTMHQKETLVQLNDVDMANFEEISFFLEGALDALAPGRRSVPAE